MKSIETIKNQIIENQKDGKYTYNGLTTDEIATYNRRMMFGENDEAFDYDEFSAWTR